MRSQSALLGQSEDMALEDESREVMLRCRDEGQMTTEVIPCQRAAN